MIRRAAHVLIRGYQLTLSGLIGRQCRHWPSCSEYTDTAIARHGLWPGGWMGFARICRCGPLGTHGIDLVPAARWGCYPTLCGETIMAASMAEPAHRRCARCDELREDTATARPARLLRRLVGR